MAGPTWANVYDLSESQLTRIDEAEEAMEMLDLSKAEEILNSLREEDPICIPVLNLLAHLHGRYLSDYQKPWGITIRFWNSNRRMHGQGMSDENSGDIPPTSSKIGSNFMDYLSICCQRWSQAHC